MKVKAAVARSRGAPLSIEGLDLDEPRDDEILVRLIASGVGRPDLDAIDGHLAMPLPFVPGGEGAGIVERVGSQVAHLAPGDAVVVTFAFCGHCGPCTSGHPRACVDFGALNLAGTRLDGSTVFSAEGARVNGSFYGQSSFATHLTCRAASAVKLATDAPLELLACLGGELLRGAGTILHGFRPRPDDAVLIIGADAVGLAATMAAKASGAKIIIVADDSERRRMLASELGATLAVRTDDDLADLVRSLAADGVRFALEATGIAAMRAACLASLGRGGTCAFVDAPADAALDFEDQIADGAVLLTSADGHAPPKVLIPELVKMHRNGALPLEKLVDFFPFEHVNDALDALRAGTVAKPVVRFSLGGFGDLDRAKVEGAANEAPADEKVEPEPVPQEVPQDLVKS